MGARVFQYFCVSFAFSLKYEVDTHNEHKAHTFMLFIQFITSGIKHIKFSCHLHQTLLMLTGLRVCLIIMSIK